MGLNQRGGMGQWTVNSSLMVDSFVEALESVICDVIKIRLKRRDATRRKIKKALPKIW